MFYEYLPISRPWVWIDVSTAQEKEVNKYNQLTSGDGPLYSQTVKPVLIGKEAAVPVTPGAVRSRPATARRAVCLTS